MVKDSKFCLTETVVTGPGQAILFYGLQSLGEGLSLGKAWDAIFTLSGAITCIGKQAQLSDNLVSLGEGQQLIIQAISKWCIRPRGTRHPCSILPVSSPFNFCNQDQSPWAARLTTATEWWEVPRHDSSPLHQEWGWALQKGWAWGQRWWELWATPSPPPSPSLDCRFESDWSSVSTSLSGSLSCDRSGGSRHSNYSWQCHRGSGGHMKINLPVFKDEDMKDAITYQSWHWDLMVYH